MDVSVILVNYNTTQLTLNAINSVIEKTKEVLFEIIIVDNNSQDRSIDCVQQMFPNLRYIKSSENIGFGRANNLGAGYAMGNYLFFLNSDTLLINNAIQILFEFLEANLNVGICGGNLFDAIGNPIHSFMKYFRNPFTDIFEKTFLSKVFKYYILHNQHNHENMAIEVAFITGADLFIRKEIFDNINGFDPDFFMYFEDAELGNRVKKKGYRIMSVPDAKIFHLVGASSSIGEAKLKLFLQSKYLYYRKVNNTLFSKFARLVDFLSAIFGFVYYSLLSNYKLRKISLYYLKFSFKN
jgi:hypothetical protein